MHTQPARAQRYPVARNALLKCVAAIALTIVAVGFVCSVNAASVTTTIPVSATVIQSCTITSGPVSFGNYNGISGAATDVIATMTPTCTTGKVYAISLDAGVGAGANASARMLTGPGGARLGYGIYTDAAHTTVWGDGSSGTVLQSGTGNGAVAPLKIYGRIPAGQNPPSGAYSDTLTVTVTY